MTDWLLALVPTYGPWLLFVATFLSCVALPIPASVLMLAAGGFVAAGDLGLASSAGAAWAGAVAGDQAGYGVGRFGVGRFRFGRPVQTGSAASGPFARATDMLARRGGLAVFFSRWLVSALGPYVNLAGGAAGLPCARFTFWSIAGEGVWVGLYVGLGATFAGNLEAASQQAVSILGFLAAGAVAIGLGAWLFKVARATPSAA
jgi:membrane-associated protein